MRLKAVAATAAATSLMSFSALADAVDDYLQLQMQERRIPGLSVAIVQGGRTVKARGYGFANLEHRIPARAETVYEIGSITKQFTAALVMMLVEEGKLRLDDRLSQHLEGVPASWRLMNVRHLLTHTSGLKNYTGLEGFEVRRKLTAPQFIKILAAQPLQSAPGEKYAYCNSAYNLLGYLIERQMGQSYWQALQARILKPLGMTNSRPRDLRAVIPHRAAGYEWDQGAWVNRDSDLTDVFSAGALVSTVLDLVKWNHALNSTNLLSDASLAQMWTPAVLNHGQPLTYGLGFGVDTHKGRKNIGHSGSTSGFSASLQRFPDDRLAVIVLCNLDEQGLATKLALAVADRYLPARR
jgi:CubicO group peptidase (beta-lactamase class C family)